MVDFESQLVSAEFVSFRRAQHSFYWKIQTRLGLYAIAIGCTLFFTKGWSDNVKHFVYYRRFQAISRSVVFLTSVSTLSTFYHDKRYAVDCIRSNELYIWYSCGLYYMHSEDPVRVALAFDEEVKVRDAFASTYYETNKSVDTIRSYSEHYNAMTDIHKPEISTRTTHMLLKNSNCQPKILRSLMSHHTRCLCQNVCVKYA